MGLILNIISITAFTLSVGQLIAAIVRARTNIEIVIEDMQFYNLPQDDRLILFVTFTNKSSSSIYVNKINVFDSYCNSISCSLTHKYIGMRTYPSAHSKEQQSELILSADFPIKIEANGVSMKYISFHLNNNFEYLDDNHFVKLELITNKKTKVFNIYCPEQIANPLSI